MSSWDMICIKCGNIRHVIREKQKVHYCYVNGIIIDNPKKLPGFCPLDDEIDKLKISANNYLPSNRYEQ